MRHFDIQPTAKQIIEAVRHKINHKTKPTGALGMLETIAAQICLIQQTLSPQLTAPQIIVFAADHGIADEGVSSYPAEVTRQMVLNFLAGGAAINVFCRQHGLALTIVDAGVKGGFGDLKDTILVSQRIGQGTRNFAREPAMSLAECESALTKGAAVVRQSSQKGCNVIGFGEMGIGNTSSAAVLMHKFTGIPLAGCVGRGTGLDDAGLARKLDILQAAVETHASAQTPLDILATFGGFEIVQMCGAMLQAAQNRMVVLVDGFIATAALLAASRLHPAILDYCVFCHQSDEHGHRKLLEFLHGQPILNLGLRLGEGTGCALAYPVLQAAMAFMNQMASFESAGVSQK